MTCSTRVLLDWRYPHPNRAIDVEIGEKISKKYHGSLNVPIEHHPTIRYMVYNGYYKVMSNIPKIGQLPTPEYVGIK